MFCFEGGKPMIDKEKLKFSEDINEHFVKGLMTGYKRYLQVRIEAYKELEISNGYAYTRGNHLEDKIAKEKFSDKITFKHEKAGSWSYLQFEVGNSGKRNLVIVRRAERIEETKKILEISTPDKKEKNWLYGLSKINDYLDLGSVINREKNSQLKLFAANSQDESAIIRQDQLELQFDQEFDGFYILTYEINEGTYMIDDASLLMMDSSSLELLQVESLRELVVKYQPIIEEDLLANVQNVFGKEEFSGEGKDYVVSPTEETAGEATDYDLNTSLEDLEENE